MAGYNDIAFRTLCIKAGAGLAYTGMINPLSRARFALGDRPAVQLFTESGRGVGAFMKKHASEAALFDLNLGCAAPVARKKRFGSYLDDLDVIEKTLKAMRDAAATAGKPVTLKMRKTAKAMEIVALAEKHCDAVCIHPRTRSQGYGGEPDMAFALSVRDAVSIPVIYSGNVGIANGLQLLKDFDFVMIGRNALGNPGIFAALAGKRCSIGFDDYLKLAQRHGLPFNQIRLHAMHFARGMTGASRLRLALSKTRNEERIRTLLEGH